MAAVLEEQGGLLAALADWDQPEDRESLTEQPEVEPVDKLASIPLGQTTQGLDKELLHQMLDTAQ